MTDSLYSLSTKDINGNTVNLSDFEGKVALVVNTASKCGFTGQYDGLEELYQTYRERGFVVLGFPSNDFAGQEPASDSEIQEFCKIRFGVTFPLFAKASVSGVSKQPVYQFLTMSSQKKFQGDPGWNFVKFLVNRKGQVVSRFAALTNPNSKRVKRAIEKALSEL